ncbi:MAG TPA: helix-turn-helix domain-containing protein [Thermoanaerobaculia bacterium]|nr:helix-turn-helix domain-containing protein [Thermoanaerobaculia bacterium]
MDYREVRPAPPLRRFLECFWFLSAQNAAGAAAEPVLPDGCTELIVHFGDPFRRVTAAGDSEVQPRAFFVGEMTRPLVVEPSRRVGTMGIRFRPGGVFPFLGLPLSELSDRVVDLDVLWARAARELEEALLESRSDAARIAVAEAFLLRRLVWARRDHAVERVVRAILAARGRERVRTFPARVGLGSRQLERRFLAAVGLAPKVFSRIVRFQNLVRIAPDANGWASAAAQCGYFDQAHLIRDVRDFAGVTPSSLLRKTGGFSKHFVSEARLAALFGDGFFQDSRRVAAQIGEEGEIS